MTGRRGRLAAGGAGGEGGRPQGLGARTGDTLLLAALQQPEVSKLKFRGTLSGVRGMATPLPSPGFQQAGGSYFGG